MNYETVPRDLNGHQAFESMSLLGALNFLSKKHIS